MSKRYISLGLMSGTSGDGVDASIINSNGTDDYESIKDRYFEYDSKIYKDIHELNIHTWTFAHDIHAGMSMEPW